MPVNANDIRIEFGLSTAGKYIRVIHLPSGIQRTAKRRERTEHELLEELLLALSEDPARLSAVRPVIATGTRGKSAMDKHTGDSYDDKADQYADDQDVSPWNQYFERPGVLRFLPNLADRDVLDAGCGPGFFTKHLVDQGARVTAFDLQPVFVERTRLRTGNRAAVRVADLAEPLDFCADASFDFVVALLTLHYLRDWQPTLAEFHRVLRPGGKLVFSTHHPFTDLAPATSGDYFATELIEDEWDFGKMRFYRRPLSKITRDLRETGYVIEEIAEPQPIQPPDGVEFRSYERAMKMPMRLLIRARAE